MKPKHEDCLLCISTRSLKKKIESKIVVFLVTLLFFARVYMICFTLQSFVSLFFLLFFSFDWLLWQQDSLGIFLSKIDFSMTSVRCDEQLTHPHIWLNTHMLFCFSLCLSRINMTIIHCSCWVLFFYSFSSAIYIEIKEEKKSGDRTEIVTFYQMKSQPWQII